MSTILRGHECALFPGVYDLRSSGSAAAAQIATARPSPRWLIDMLAGPLVDAALALLERANKVVRLWTLRLPPSRTIQRIR